MTQTIKLLLVEDNPADVATIKRLLGRARMFEFGITTTDYLNSALMLLAHPRDGQFDVIFLDLNLQDSRGIETVTAVHRAVPEVPIVVLSGQEDIKIADLTLKCGATDFVVKKAVGEGVEHDLIEELERKAVFAVRRQQQLMTTHQLSRASMEKAGARLDADPVLVHAIRAHVMAIDIGITEFRTYLQLNYPEAWDALQRVYADKLMIPLRDIRIHLKLDDASKRDTVLKTQDRSLERMREVLGRTPVPLAATSLEEAERELLEAMRIDPFKLGGEIE